MQHCKVRLFQQLGKVVPHVYSDIGKLSLVFEEDTPWGDLLYLRVDVKF